MPVRRFIIFAILFTSNISFSQDKIYYIDWCENFLTENLYDIKRVVQNHPEKKFQYIFHDYYKNGSLRTTGLAKSRNGKTKDGDFIFYYENGNKMASGALEKDYKVGNWQYWDEHGNVVPKDSLIKRLSSINQNIDSIFYKGKCLCYLKESSWVKTNIVSKKTTEYEYSDGNQIAVNNFFHHPDDTAKYKTGREDLYRDLQKKIKYPFTSRLKGNEGRVLLSFDVDSKGNVINPKIKNSIDKKIDYQIIEAILSTSGSWKPATYKGRPVGSRLSISLVFKLN